MKHSRNLLVGVVLAALHCLMAVPAQAQFTYNNNGAITITGYTGAGGEVIIPSTIDGLPVTGIGSLAFEYCSSLTSVTIPNSVTNIESYAFYDCTSLTSITVDALNASYSSVDGVLFDKSQTTLIKCPGGKAGSYIIPNSVTTIEDATFDHCTSLTNVTIPDSVTSIGSYAFEYCSSLTSITIPNSVTTIKDSTFSLCSSLASVTIGSGVTTIGKWAFSYCSNLTSVTIPNNVTGIGRSAFGYCTSLTSIIIPNSVTNIESYAFNNCISLTSVTVDVLNASYSSVDGVLFDKNQTTLIRYPGGRAGSCIIPNSVTNIEGGTFENCTSLTSITVDALNASYSSVDGVLFDKGQTTLIKCPGGRAGSYIIPNSVTTIGYTAFENCTSLTNVTIPNSVTSIGSYAFYDCTSITSIMIPNSVTTIAYAAFSFCSSLTSIYFHGNAPSLDSSLFAYVTVYYLSGTTGWGATYGGRPTIALTGEPEIIQQPFSLTNHMGDTVLFNVSVVNVFGVSPMGCQWQFNGTNLNDDGRIRGSQTCNLTVSNIQPSDAGNYAVIITNAYGSVTSSPARLTVVLPSSASLLINILGKGSVTGFTNGQTLLVGQTFTPKLKAGKGYKLTNWLVEVNGTTVVSTNKVVPFVMLPNLVVTATFVDVQKPALKVVSPKNKQAVQTETLAISGTVKDNGTGGTVWYQLNGGSWEAASGWTNWNGLATLIPGANTLLVYAQDEAGNRSKTNVLSVTYQKAYRLADYFPQPLGGYWKFDGTDSDGWPLYMTWEVTDTNYPVDLYTGSPVRQYFTNSIKMECAYLDHGAQFPYDTWEEYRGIDPLRVIMYGHDDLPDETMRVGGGLYFPAQLAVGTTATVKAPVYSFGQSKGTLTATFQLLDVGALTVPAGTFTDVIHLRFTLSAGGGSESKEWWWARGVGQIKSAGASGSGSSLNVELVEYSVPSANPNVAVQSQALPMPAAQIDTASIGLAGGQFTFNYTGVVGKTVVIEASANLKDWQPVQTNVLTDTGTTYFSDPQWTNYPGRFYRVRTQ